MNHRLRISRQNSQSDGATDKGLANPVACVRDVGPFHPTSSVVFGQVNGGKACFPKTPASGDASWDSRRRAKEDEALLWRKMEWFSPLWLPMDKIHEMLSAVRHCTKERAIELFDYHTSTLYTVAFQAVCIAQIMPRARSLQEIIPLAREAYLGAYSGYRASSIAALIPAIEGSLTRIVSGMNPGASAPDKIDHAINRANQTAADLHFEGMWVPDDYKTVDYLFGQDEHVFAFETFRRWLKDFFFCNTACYQGLTWLNRHMFCARNCFLLAEADQLHAFVDSTHDSGRNRILVRRQPLCVVHAPRHERRQYTSLAASTFSS